MSRLLVLFVASLFCSACTAAEVLQVDSLEGLYQAAADSGKTIRVQPGTYVLADYLTDQRLAELKRQYPDQGRRPTRWLLRFSGSDNTFDFTGVIIEIDTALYAKLPYGYTRCLFIDGDNNTFKGLTVRNTGPADRGSNGNHLSVFGDGNTLEGIRVNVSGSSPYGYGDLLGKGGPPGLLSPKKQSGIMVAGQDNTLRRCKVISRAFGHCFYIQSMDGKTAQNILLEDCYAEGVTRTTNAMLSDTEGAAFDLGFRSAFKNRDGRFMITPGYTKSLSEDGFRAYGGTGSITFRNCTAVNTRAGFEVRNTRDQENKTVLEGCLSLGAERAFLLGSNVRVRDCRGDVVHGPLLYLRPDSSGSDIELELIGGLPETTVHALATIAGKDHAVRLFTEDKHRPIAALPIMLGFGMPEHAEMASAIHPAETAGVSLVNEIGRATVIRHEEIEDCPTKSAGSIIDDKHTQRLKK